MNVMITDKSAQDSIKESRAALRGMNTHVATILQHNVALAETTAKQAGLLRSLADKLGVIVVMQYDHSTSGQKPVSVKDELHRIANTLLEGAAK